MATSCKIFRPITCFRVIWALERCTWVFKLSNEWMNIDLHSWGVEGRRGLEIFCPSGILHRLFRLRQIKVPTGSTNATWSHMVGHWLGANPGHAAGAYWHGYKGRFGVSGSSCGTRSAIFRKMCCHSLASDTLQVQESKRCKYITNIEQWRWFFYAKMNFHGFRENLLQTKAELIAWFKLLIIHWSLGKNKTSDKFVCSNKHQTNQYWTLCTAADLNRRSVTCSSKECLLRFKWNSTATSNGGTLGNDLWHELKSIASKCLLKAI